MSLNLISPATFTTGVLIGDTIDTANSGTDSIPKLTMVAGFPVTASLEIQSQTGGLLISRITEGERDSMVVVDGFIIYNTTTNMFNLRENGAWILLGAGNGDVTGPNGAIPNNIATFADASGKVIHDSGVGINLVPPPLGAHFHNLLVNEVSDLDIIAFKDTVSFIFANAVSPIMGYFIQTAAPFEHSVLITDGVTGLNPLNITSPSAILELNSNVGAILLSRMNTIDRDALTAVNGMMIYNSNSDRFEVYQNGIWQVLGTGGSVTSVAAVVPFGSHGLTITGSPIINSGTFTFTLGTELQGLAQLSSAGPNLGLGGVYRTGTGTYVNRALVGTSNQINISHLDGVLGDPTFTIADNAIMPGTHGITLPIGNNLNYPIFPHNGMIRYNTSTNQVEGYINGAWRNLFSGIVPPGTVVAVGASSVTPGVTVNVSPVNPIVAAGTIDIGLNPELVGLSQLATNGIITRSGAGIYSPRTIQGTAQQITVINGDGVGGNPFISIANDPVIPLNGGITIPRGAQAQRPPLPLAGTMRFNLSNSTFEGWNGANWLEFGNASGAPTDAQYILQRANAALPNAQNLAALVGPQIPIPTPPGSVLLKKIAVGVSGVIVGAVPGIDYVTVASFQAVQTQITTLQGQVATLQGQVAAIQLQLSTLTTITIPAMQLAIAAAAGTAATALALATTASNNLQNGQFVVKTKTSGMGSDVQELSLLGVGLLKNNAGGFLSIAGPGDGFYGPGNPTFLRDTNGSTNNLFMGTPGGNATMTGGGNHGFTIGGMANLTTGSDCAGFGFDVLRSAQTTVRCLAYGTGALFTTVSSMDSIAIGTGSLQNSTANQNLALGNNALNRAAANPSANTALGFSCLEFLVTGNANLAAGFDAGGSLTTGSNNTLLGLGACFLGTNFSDCVAVGTGCLAGNLQSQNTGVGSQCLVVSDNASNLTALGYKSLNACRTADSCTAIGHSSQLNNVSGTNNTSTGWGSLMALQTGINNCSYGVFSGVSLIDGNFNSFYGVSAGNNSLHGTDNTFLGYVSGYSISSGSSNVIIGSGTARNAGNLNTTVNSTVMVGSLAGVFQTNYNACTFIGTAADASVDNLSGATAIGVGARVSSDNSIILGTSSNNVGIGVTDAKSPLHLNGTMRQHGVTAGYTGCEMFKSQSYAQTTGGNAVGLQVTSNPNGSFPQAVSVKVEILGLTRDGTSAGYAESQTGIFFNPAAASIGAFPAINFTSSAGFTGTANWSIIGGNTLTLTVSSAVTNVQWIVNYEYFYTTAVNT